MIIAIPKKMNNEESKAVAAVIVEERAFHIQSCKLTAALERLNKLDVKGV